MIYLWLPPSKILLFAPTLTTCLLVELVLYFARLNFQLFSERRKEKRNLLFCVLKDGINYKVSVFPYSLYPTDSTEAYFLCYIFYLLSQGGEWIYATLGFLEKTNSALEEHTILEFTVSLHPSLDSGLRIITPLDILKTIPPISVQLTTVTETYSLVCLKY